MIFSLAANVTIITRKLLMISLNSYISERLNSLLQLFSSYSKTWLMGRKKLGIKMFTPNVTIIHKTTALVQYFMADQRDLISPIHEFHSKCQEEHVHSINLLEVGYIDKYVANP